MTDPITDIRDTLFHARLCCEAWWQMEGEHDNRTVIVAGFQEFPVLFETIRPALFTCFVVKLCSLFGTRDDEITLKSIPDAERDCGFDSVWRTGRIVYKYRSKILAHRDNKKSPEDIARGTGLTFNDLRNFILEVCALYDRLANAQGSPRLPDISCSKELLYAAYLLSQSNESQDDSAPDPQLPSIK